MSRYTPNNPLRRTSQSGAGERPFVGVDRLTVVREYRPSDLEAIFEINAESLPGVSTLTPEYFEQLIGECALFRLIEVENQVAGYLCAMNRHASYDGAEFQWFCEYFRDDFLYIDQVAVGRRYRRGGIGRALYEDLEEYASRSGIDTLVCEVNYDPINLESQTFHEQRGFGEVGRMETRGMVVSLLAKTGLSRTRGT